MTISVLISMFDLSPISDMPLLFVPRTIYFEVRCPFCTVATYHPGLHPISPISSADQCNFIFEPIWFICSARFSLEGGAPSSLFFFKIGVQSSLFSHCCFISSNKSNSGWNRDWRSDSHCTWDAGGMKWGENFWRVYVRLRYKCDDTLGYLWLKIVW